MKRLKITLPSGAILGIIEATLLGLSLGSGNYSRAWFFAVMLVTDIVIKVLRFISERKKGNNEPRD